MIIIYISLGSNLSGTMGSPEKQVTTAIQSLARIDVTQVLAVSSLYRSKPVGLVAQGDYINAVAKLETGLSALALLDNLQAIEAQHGRVRKQHWGPRTLDLDLLLYGSEQIHNERLTVPHVEMLTRPFVLVPLSEINPDEIIPGGNPIRDYLQVLDQADLKILG